MGTCPCSFSNLLVCNNRVFDVFVLLRSAHDVVGMLLIQITTDDKHNTTYPPGYPYRDIDSTYNYRPTEWVCAVFVTLFAISTRVYHLFLSYALPVFNTYYNSLARLASREK